MMFALAHTNIQQHFAQVQFYMGMMPEIEPATFGSVNDMF